MAGPYLVAAYHSYDIYSPRKNPYYGNAIYNNTNTNTTPRSKSLSTPSSNNPYASYLSSSDTPTSPTERSNSTSSASNNPSNPTSPFAALTDDDIIIITVKLTSPFRRSSIEGGAELPDRPPARGFLRRMSTRWHGPVDDNRYKAVKMPRGEYMRHFRRDAQGNYVGTEPERQWSEEDLEREFGEYQKVPLNPVLVTW